MGRVKRSSPGSANGLRAYRVTRQVQDRSISMGLKRSKKVNEQMSVDDTMDGVDRHCQMERCRSTPSILEGCAAAVVEDGRKVLSSVVFSQIKLHQPCL